MSWAVDIASVIKNRTESSYDEIISEFGIGTVLSTAPLSIEMFGQKIDDGIYISKALMLGAETESEIDNIFADTPVLPTQFNPYTKLWFDFLKEYHKRTVIKKGDLVLVMYQEAEFYVISRFEEV